MPQVALTDAFVRGGKSVTGELVEWSDTKERGLALRVTAAGVKSWTFRYRDAAGERRRISLGRLDDVPLYDARAAAAAERARLHGGADPATMRKEAKAAAVASRLDTVEEIGRRYLAESRVGRHKPNGKPKREVTVAALEGHFNRAIVPKLGGERLAGLTRARLQAFVNDVLDKRSASVARECRVVLQGIFAFAVWHEIVPTNPMQFVNAQLAPARERVLTDDELRAVWKAFDRISEVEDAHVSRGVCLAVLVAAATLQRRAEVTGMRRTELDFVARTWTIPGDRTKNHRTHVVPLSPLALRLIGEALRLAGNGAFAFPSPRDAEKPIQPQAMSHAWRRVAAAVKIEGLRPHDLRRTGATNLTSERIGVPRFVVSKVLNHVSDAGGGAAVTAVYDRNAYLPEKRRALDAWAALLDEIVEDRPRAGNVVRLAG